MKKLICDYCGNKFIVLKKHLHRLKAKTHFCKKLCYVLFQRKYHILNFPLPKKGRKGAKGWHHTEKFKKYMHNINHGKNHPQWRGGLSFEGYDYEFDNNLKEQVRFRDKYKCQLCGCSQLENGKSLDTHHIDYDKTKSNINNLIALCNNCHMKTNFNREYYINLFQQKIGVKVNEVAGLRLV